MNPSIIILLPKLNGDPLKWTKEDVRTMIERRNLGKIRDIVLQSDRNKQSAIVHFDYWTNLEIAKHFAVGGNMTVDALYGKRMVMNIYDPKC